MRDAVLAQLSSTSLQSKVRSDPQSAIPNTHSVISQRRTQSGSPPRCPLPKSSNDPRNLLARSNGSSDVTSFNPSGWSSLAGSGSSPLSSFCLLRTTNRMVIWYTRNIKRCLNSPFCELASSQSGDVSVVALRAAFLALLSAFLDTSAVGSVKRKIA